MGKFLATSSFIFGPVCQYCMMMLRYNLSRSLFPQIVDEMNVLLATYHAYHAFGNIGNCGATKFLGPQEILSQHISDTLMIPER